MADFVLLGAGFSRALSVEMPLLPDLGRLVLAELDGDDEDLAAFDYNLERWMSFLASDQPWLSDSENMRNRALFLEASQAVQSVVSGREDAALRQSPPAWAARLIWHWCNAEARVTTFNYDVLVERLASELRLVNTWADLYTMPLTERKLPGAGAMLGYSEPTNPIFTLFKLHGSTNWMYGGPVAPVTEQPVITRLQSPWRPDEFATPRRSNSLHDDLAPLIVPPTGIKDLYYGNRSLRAQWRQAFEELQFATSVTIIGYSFPPTDTTTRNFFSSADVRCPITVVDYRPEAVEPVRLLAPHANIELFSGEFAASDYVDANCGDIVRWSASRTDEGFVPTITVNGQEMKGLALKVSDQVQAHALAREQVDRRWPGLSSDAPPAMAGSDALSGTWLSLDAGANRQFTATPLAELDHPLGHPPASAGALTYGPVVLRPEAICLPFARNAAQLAGSNSSSAELQDGQSPVHGSQRAWTG